MWSKVFRIAALVLAVMMLMTAMIGCAGTAKDSGQGTTTQQATEQTAAVQVEVGNYWDMLDKVQDSSELPDWKGEQLNLKVWVGHGTGDPKRPKSESDVVWPEIKRVTGVSYDIENSYDNSGQTFDVKLSMLAAANDWPDLLVAPGGNFKSLADSGKIYDLTEVFSKYCPNYSKKVPADKLPDVYGQASVNAGYKDKIYTFPGQIGPEWLPVLNPDIDLGKFASIAQPVEIWGWPSPLWVRDDILKMVFPNSKTKKELEDHYMQNGKFTKEEVFDVPINTKEDFFKFLRDIKALGVKENGKPVEPTFVYSAGDNFALLTCLNSILSGYTVFNSHFTYWDNITKKVEYMFKQDWFKQDLKEFTRLVQDGTVPKECLVDTAAAFDEKLKGGLYAVGYAWCVPDNALLEKQGKSYRYRKVYMNIPPNNERFLMMTGKPNSGNQVAIFKGSVKEEQLEQVMRYLDFTVSDIGEKLIYWGPKSAGLWEENNGKRVFVDKELEDAMVYGAQNNSSLKYNLFNVWSQQESAWPGYPHYVYGGSTLHPRYVYDKVRNAGETDMYFSTGFVSEVKEYLGEGAHLWNFEQKIPNVDKFNKAKQAWEDSMTKIFTARNDEEFEKLYNEMVTLAEKNGLDDKTLEEMNNLYVNDVNAGYMDFRLKRK